MGDKNIGQEEDYYYSSVCRTCLQPYGELQDLSATINDKMLSEDENITYLDCLYYCMPTSAVPDESVEGGQPSLPKKLCIDCASALQVSYWFLRNACKAQDMLKVRLKELKEKRLKQEQIEKELAEQMLKKPKRFRCKVCNTKLETKRSLKDHVKLHLDLIVYYCQLCSFEHNQRNYLIEHYQLVHNVAATANQLKPKTKTSLPPRPARTASVASTSTVASKCDNYVNEKPHQNEMYMEPLKMQNSNNITFATQQATFVYANSVNPNETIPNQLDGNMESTPMISQTNLDSFAFNTFENGLNAQNDISMGNEFIVMADGSVKDMGKGVVIEYINSSEGGSLAVQNGLVLDNIIQVQNADTTSMVLSQNDIVQMDVDDLIVEEPENSPEQTQDVPQVLDEEDMIPATFIEQPRKNNCKVCAKECATQIDLKNHMLTHDEIPHFFCDKCTFYTFFKIDLNQHYKSKHNVQPTSRQLQPKNKQRNNNSDLQMDKETKRAIVQKIERHARLPKMVYFCHICYYECDLKYEIRRHYLNKHNKHVQDVQQRPTRAGKTINAITNISPKREVKPAKIQISSIEQQQPQQPDYPNGLNCRKCQEMFYWRKDLYQHYKLHNAEEEALKQQKQTVRIQKPIQQAAQKSVPQMPALQPLQQESQPQILQAQLQQQQSQQQMQLQEQSQQQLQLQEQTQQTTHEELQQQFEQQLHSQLQPQLQYETSTNLQLQQELQSQSDLQQQQQSEAQQLQSNLQLDQLPQPHQEVVITTTTSMDDTIPTFTNVDPMSLVLTPNNTLNHPAPLTPSSSSTYTLPSDAIPQIVEMEQTIETDMDFDFNGDSLFEDFDDVDVENESDDNDLRNILLTSDDDFDDMLKEQGETPNTADGEATTSIMPSYCAQCQKSFLSQYQFENHMFLHRGLAPYRCEMCTNLYNTKRALIRHYNAVHKKIPSRDMIQAKGDKVYVHDKCTSDSLNIEESKTTTLMCAKCTYESTDFPSVQLHLNTNHSIHDDSYILKKLPYECPRCIRSYSTKTKLLRHLERNHALTPINHTQMQVSSTSSDTNATTINDSTNASALENNVNMMQMNATSAEHECCIEDYKGQELFDHREDKTATCDENDISIYQCVAPTFVTTSNEDNFNTTALLSGKDTNVTLNTNCTAVIIRNHLEESGTKLLNLTTTRKDNASFALVPKNSTSEASVEHILVLYKCPICHFACKDLEDVKLHGKRNECRNIAKHLKDPSPHFFKCEVCESKYKTMYLLKHHLKRHIARDFHCSSCSKAFVSKLELDFHERTHTDERPFRCEKCPNSFRYAHHLKRHKDIIHFGKRHICMEANCNRQFTTLDQLKVHRWSHFGIVPYKCKYCKRLFKKRVLLRNHCWKFHKTHLSEEEVAENFRNNLGYSSPHDMTVATKNGSMLRRIDWESLPTSLQ